MKRPLKLEPVLFGSQGGGDPEEHPRWDGERIRRYDEELVMWNDDNEEWEDDQA